jgi:hypothetical protein
VFAVQAAGRAVGCHDRLSWKKRSIFRRWSESVIVASVMRERITYSEYCGIAMADRIAMIATAIISSMRVNPCWVRIRGPLWRGV